MMAARGLLLITVLWLPAGGVDAVEITETDRERRPHFRIESEGSTWFYDRAGGGFSGLVDSDGRDWIAFHKNPLSKFPDSAAAGYRGIPNAVFIGPDKGAGHPGFDRCRTIKVADDTIRSFSLSGKWAWSWKFTEQTATFTMERADPEQQWWFLYEGPIAGTFEPSAKYWGTNQGGPRSDVPGSSNQLFDRWRWIYFGDRGVRRILLIVQHQEDALTDTLWYLGSSQRGSPSAADGMVVFGFGRGPGTSPEFRGADQRFTVSLLEAAGQTPDEYQRIVKRVGAILAAD